MTDKAELRAQICMLADHGPVVAGKGNNVACNLIEDLADTAGLAMPTRWVFPRQLSQADIQGQIAKSNVEWDI